MNPVSSIVVSFLNCFGNFFEHYEFFMHGEFGLIMPHGPCIINSATILYSNGLLLGSGISAEMNLFICHGSRILSSL